MFFGYVYINDSILTYRVVTCYLAIGMKAAMIIENKHSMRRNTIMLRVSE